jgi:hypothetical protein
MLTEIVFGTLVGLYVDLTILITSNGLYVQRVRKGRLEPTTGSV